MELPARFTMQMVSGGTKVNLHSKMFWREKYIHYTVTQTYSEIQIVYSSGVNATQFHCVALGHILQLPVCLCTQFLVQCFA